VAKAIGLVKKEFLRPPPPILSSTSTGLQNNTVSQTKVVSAKEKKSKRQLKRERHQVLSLSLSLSRSVYLCVFQVSKLKGDDPICVGANGRVCACINNVCALRLRISLTLWKERKEKEKKKKKLLPDYNRDVSEPLQEQKSTRSICPLIEKTGDVSLYPNNDNCRFSHDLQGFKDQVVEFVECAIRF
jgi:hypothetical protein